MRKVVVSDNTFYMLYNVERIKVRVPHNSTQWREVFNDFFRSADKDTPIRVCKADDTCQFALVKDAKLKNGKFELKIVKWGS